MARRLRIGIILLTCVDEVTAETVFSLGSLKFKKNMEKPEAAESDQCDLCPGIHRVDGTSKMQIFCVTKTRERSHLMTSCNYFKKSYKADGAQFLLTSGMDTSCGLRGSG